MLDRSILAGCIHRLKDEQQRPAVLRVKHFLLFSEPNGAALSQFGRFSFVHFQSAGVARIEIFKAKTLAVGNSERCYVFLNLIQDFLSRHGAISLWPDAQCSAGTPKCCNLRRNSRNELRPWSAKMTRYCASVLTSRKSQATLFRDTPERVRTSDLCRGRIRAPSLPREGRR